MQIQEETDLTNLLEEMIQSASAPSLQSPSAEESVLPQLFEKKNYKKRRLSLFPLFLSIAFLGGLGLGAAFGFYWGQRQSFPESLPSPPVSEIIQPLTPSHHHLV